MTLAYALTVYAVLACIIAGQARAIERLRGQRAAASGLAESLNEALLHERRIWRHPHPLLHATSPATIDELMPRVIDVDERTETL